MTLKYLPIPILILFFFLLFSYHTIYRHQTYQSNAFDLGIYTQAVYLYSQGVTPISTLKHMNILGDHFGLILFFLSPVYKLFPNAQTLLIIQALFVSISGIFIYLIALDKLRSSLQSIIITIAYLSTPGILSAINFDFHLATISVLPLSIMLYSWYFKKWRLYLAGLFFSVLFKEDLPLFIIGLGLFSLTKKQLKVGLFSIIFGFLSFYLIKYQIMNYLSPGAQDSYINTSSLPLTNPLALLNLLITKPNTFINIFIEPGIKKYTLATLYGQFLFLPILSGLSWFSIFPYLLLRFSSNQFQYWGTSFHYNANLAPFLAASTIFALAKIKVPKYLINTLLILSILFSNLYLNTVIVNTFGLNFEDTKDYTYLNDSLQTISKDVAVSAQSPIVPHLANRNKVYLYPEVLDADYIVLDQALGYYPMQNIEFKDRIEALKKDPDWILEQRTSLLIFKRKI